MERAQPSTMTSVSEEQIIRYLLGQMPKEECSKMEEHLERDPSFFEQIASVEDDMIMHYVRGDLEDRLLPRFTEIYLESPTRRARVEQAQLFYKSVHEAAQLRPANLLERWFPATTAQFRVAVVAAGALVVLIVVLIIVRGNKSAPRQHTPADVAQVSFSLDSGQARGEGGVQISVPSRVTQVQFMLTPPTLAVNQSYGVVLGTPERPGVWSGLAVRKDSKLVTVVPAGLLTAGDYTLKLQDAGANGGDVAAYYFRVAK